MPCYNPSEGWEERVVLQFDEIKSVIPEAEIVFVNDGSKIFEEKKLTKLFTPLTIPTVITYNKNKAKATPFAKV